MAFFLFFTYHSLLLGYIYIYNFFLLLCCYLHFSLLEMPFLSHWISVILLSPRRKFNPTFISFPLQYIFYYSLYFSHFLPSSLLKYMLVTTLVYIAALRSAEFRQLIKVVNQSLNEIMLKKIFTYFLFLPLTFYFWNTGAYMGFT